MITPLPTTPPTKTDPINFDARADALFGALPTLISEINSTAAAADTAKTQAQTAAAGTVAAQGYANTATTKAGEASASASAALGYRNQAQGYRDQAAVYAGGGVTSVNGVSGPGAITIPIGSSAWSAITGKPTTQAALAINDVGLPVVTSAAQSVFAGQQNQTLVCTNAGQTNCTLPASPSGAWRIRVVFSNVRLDNAVYASGGQPIKVLGTDVPSGQYVLLDVFAQCGYEFFYVPALGCWFMV